MVVSNCLFDKIQNHLGEVHLSMFVGKGLDYINWCGTHSDCGQSLGCSVGKVSWALSLVCKNSLFKLLLHLANAFAWTCIWNSMLLSSKSMSNSLEIHDPRHSRFFFNKAASFVLVSKTETSCTRSVCQFSGTQNKTEKIIPSQWKGDRLKIEHWHQHY